MEIRNFYELEESESTGYWNLIRNCATIADGAGKDSIPGLFNMQTNANDFFPDYTKTSQDLVKKIRAEIDLLEDKVSGNFLIVSSAVKKLIKGIGIEHVADEDLQYDEVIVCAYNNKPCKEANCHPNYRKFKVKF